MRGWKTSDDDLQKALDSLDMLSHKNLYVSQCSEGLKKRASLSRLYLSILFGVEFWLLDEPINELDQKSIILFNKLIKKFLENKGTVLLACHELKSFDFSYELINLDLLK
jgi:ABC-type transport system involved in cytochrome c biogenesis ATPase subunit